MQLIEHETGHGFRLLQMDTSQIACLIVSLIVHARLLVNGLHILVLWAN